MKKKILSSLAAGMSAVLCASFFTFGCADNIPSDGNTPPGGDNSVVTNPPAEVDKVPEYEQNGSTLIIHKAGVYRFEAECADIENYQRATVNKTDVVESSSASRGAYLSAQADNDLALKDSFFSFDFNLSFDAEIVMTAAYSQLERYKSKEIDMRASYCYRIDGLKTVGLTDGYTLSARKNTADWQPMAYDAFSLPKGQHWVRVSVAEKTGSGNPNIDYVEFDVKQTDSTVYDVAAVPDNDFHTPLQYAYLSGNAEDVFAYVKGAYEWSRPNPILLDFSGDGIESSDSYVLEYSASSDFANSTVVKDLRVMQHGVYNLELGQKLFWRAAASETGLASGKLHSLTVAENGPRNLYIENVTNVRDVGGYSSSLAANGKIRQGLYFRGAKLDKITASGKRELLRLGIKTEIDLRDAYQCYGPYVDGVEYHNIPIPSGTESTRFEEFAEEYAGTFALIAEAATAPVYLHCSEGADRTGIVSVMLLAVLGVSRDDIVRDYLYTNFSTVGIRTMEREFNTWWEKLENLEGATTAEKAETWLLSKGMTAEQVEKIRKTFIEGYGA